MGGSAFFRGPVFFMVFRREFLELGPVVGVKGETLLEALPPVATEKIAILK